MISKKCALSVLNESLKTGAEYAEIYQEETISKTIVLTYKRVDAVTTTMSSGIGLRLFKDGKQVYGYTSEVSMKNLMKLANELALSFEGERKLTVENLKEKKCKRINNVLRPFMDEDVTSIIERLKSAEKAGYDVSDKIVNMMSSLRCSQKNVTTFTSLGYITRDLRSNIIGGVMATAKNENNVYGNQHINRGYLGGYEKFDNFDFVKAAVECARIAIEKCDAKDSPSGQMTVVIGNGFGGTLFHEACGHPLEADAIVHNRSRFVGKIGQQIASSIVTAIDDGTIDGGWGSINFDDEGERATKNVLIEKGILKNYMVDRFNGEKAGLKPTGSSRRESYRYAPTSRMTNTYIAAGESTFDEIISSVKYGVYCKSFKGGQVSPATNNFNFSSDEVYMIRDGKICELVKPVVLVGYGYDILMKIDMVGNDLALGNGMCGASSGSVPVQVGQPTVRINGITVGGTAKEEK